LGTIIKEAWELRDDEAECMLLPPVALERCPNALFEHITLSFLIIPKLRRQKVVVNVTSVSY